MSRFCVYLTTVPEDADEVHSVRLTVCQGDDSTDDSMPLRTAVELLELIHNDVRHFEIVQWSANELQQLGSVLRTCNSLTLTDYMPDSLNVLGLTSGQREISIVGAMALRELVSDCKSLVVTFTDKLTALSFPSPSTLYRLRVSNSPNLKLGDMRQLTALVVLDILGSCEVVDDFVDTLPRSLNKLHVKHLGTSSITALGFQSFSRLSDVHISGLHSLRSISFVDCPRLQCILLSLSKLESLSCSDPLPMAQHVMRGLPHLRSIDVTGSPTMRLELFEMPSLDFVKAGGNLEQLVISGETCPNISSIYIFNNNFKDDGLVMKGTFPRLYSFRAGRNQFTRVPFLAADAPALQVLDMQHNRIRHTEQVLSSFPALIEVSLEGNFLRACSSL